MRLPSSLKQKDIMLLRKWNLATKFQILFSVLNKPIRPKLSVAAKCFLSGENMIFFIHELFLSLLQFFLSRRDSVRQELA